MRAGWDAAAVRRWCRTALAGLLTAREEIDRLNVYPVPDGDTGSNMVLTMQSVADALAGPLGDLAQTVTAMADGALEGARGNSGVILCQFLRGVAERLSGPGAKLDGIHLADALSRAAELGRAAVADPTEGTMLSVASAAAAAAAAVAGGGADLAAVAQAAAEAARAALLRTPEQLPVLAAAGVVDAGGRGLVVLLDALLAAATGEQPEPLPAAAARTPVVPREPDAGPAARESGSPEFGYEVQYLLQAADTRNLRSRLAMLGDSLVVVGGDGRWAVHVHTNDVGLAVEAGVQAGRVERITVTRFADAETSVRSGRAVVAVSPGEGLARLFTAGGAAVVTGLPTEDVLLAAVLATRAAEVVLLPNDAALRSVAAAAAAAARTRGCRAVVVPTRSPMQGLAALAVADAQREFGEEVIALTDAAGSTRWAELVRAEVGAATSAGRCAAGDALGLIEGDVAVVHPDLADAAGCLLDRMLGAGGELLTLVTGDGLPGGLAEDLLHRVRRTWPAVEVTLYDGSPGCAPLLVGVE